jgi:hypothetical protein
MIRRFQIWLAHRRLQKLVERQRNSFECEQFRRKRAAMLKHTRGLGA